MATWADLCRPFPQSYQPLHTDARLKFWTDSVSECLLQSRTAVFCIKELKKAFERNGITPQCLITVVKYLRGLGLVSPLAVMKVTLEKDSTLSAFTRPVLNTLKTASTLLQRGLGYEENELKFEEEQFVSRTVLKTLSSSLLELSLERGSSNPGFGSLSDFNELRHISKELFADEVSFRLILHNLIASGMCKMITETDGNQIFWFLNDPTTNIMPSEVQLQLYRLQKLARKLEMGINRSQETLQKYDELIRNYRQRNILTSAIRYVKLKKNLKDAVVGDEHKLEQISLLIREICEAQSSAEVLSVYRNGAATLKRLKTSAGLPVTDVNNAVLQFEKSLKERETIRPTNSTDYEKASAYQFPDDVISSTNANEFMDNLTKDQNLGSHGFSFSANPSGLPSDKVQDERDGRAGDVPMFPTGHPELSKKRAAGTS